MTDNNSITVGNHQRSPKAYAVIFAGGTGSRMEGAKIPKQFLLLGGKPIIVHTLEHFENAEEIESVVVACHEPSMGKMKAIVDQFNIKKVSAIVPGGKTGQDSIYNGLRALKSLPNPPAAEDVVLIHDGVRPLIDKMTISDCVLSVEQHGSTAVTVPATETVVVIEGGQVIEVVDRNKCQLARAPQGFRFCEIMDSHERARKEGFHDAIDSVSLMARYGYSISVVSGPDENIKITTPRDFFAFKSFVDMKEVAQIWVP